MEKTDRKKPIRRTAVETCEGFKIQLLKAQVLAMQEGEAELVAACGEMGVVLADALKQRQANNECTPIDDTVATSTIPASS